MFRDLRSQLLLWTFLPLAVILIIIAYVGVNGHQAEMRDMVFDRDEALARVVASQWSESLATHATLLPTLDPRPEAVCGTACAAFDGGVAMFDQTATLARGQPPGPQWPARQPRVYALIASRGGTFSEPFVENGSTMVLVLTRVLEGYLVGAFKPPPLSSLGFGQRGVAYVIDRAGTIIAHPDPARLGQNITQQAGIAALQHGEAGATFRVDASGTELVVGYAPIAEASWGLVIEEPWADVVDPMFQYSTLFPIVFLVVAIGALAAVYFGIRNVIRPLQNLAQIANRIAYGDYRAAERPVSGVHEIEELRETLDDMAHKVHAAQDAMQSYITAITRGQEDERRRLARELHDDTIQSLIALQQRIELAQKAMPKDPALADARLTELKTLLGDTLTSVRRFVRDLRPTYLAELGLIPALETLTHETHATFAVQGEKARLDEERELVLFRIVQEALRNVTKHARAANVSVVLAFNQGEVTATIQDDGLGFDAPEAPSEYANAGHFGLMGMQERAQLFGGSVFVKSERGKGTKVVAYLPIRN